MADAPSRLSVVAEALIARETLNGEEMAQLVARAQAQASSAA